MTVFCEDVPKLKQIVDGLIVLPNWVKMPPLPLAANFSPKGGGSADRVLRGVESTDKHTGPRGG